MRKQIRSIIFLIGAIACGGMPQAFGVVGHEDIEEETRYRLERQHETMLRLEAEKYKEFELLDELQRIEEDAPAEDDGSAEHLSDEQKQMLKKDIALLQAGVVETKKKWRRLLRAEPFVRTTYNSNLYRSPKRERKPDVYIETGALLGAGFSSSKSQVEFKYRGSRVTHLKETKRSRWEQKLETELGYRISQKTNVTGYYRLNLGSQQTSEIRSLLQRIRQNMGFSLNQRLSRKMEVRIRASHDRQDFMKKSEKANSSGQYQIGPEFNYYLTQKTAIFGRYSFGVSTGGQNKSNQAVAHDFRAGLRGKIAPKTTALINAGITTQKNTGSVKGNNTAFVAEAMLISQLTAKTRAEVYMNRGFSQAVETEGSSFFVTTNFGMRASTQFTRRLLGQIELSIRRNTFDREGTLKNSSQHDTILTQALRVEYKLWKWLFGGVQYNLDLADSNNKASQYIAHRLLFDLRGRF